MPYIFDGSTLFVTDRVGSSNIYAKLGENFFKRNQLFIVNREGYSMIKCANRALDRAKVEMWRGWFFQHAQAVGSLCQ
jgi:hypothetical protein